MGGRNRIHDEIQHMLDEIRLDDGWVDLISSEALPKISSALADIILASARISLFYVIARIQTQRTVPCVTRCDTGYKKEVSQPTNAKSPGATSKIETGYTSIYSLQKQNEKVNTNTENRPLCHTLSAKSSTLNDVLLFSIKKLQKIVAFENQVVYTNIIYFEKRRILLCTTEFLTFRQVPQCFL